MFMIDKTKRRKGFSIQFFETDKIKKAKKKKKKKEDE